MKVRKTLISMEYAEPRNFKRYKKTKGLTKKYFVIEKDGDGINIGRSRYVYSKKAAVDLAKGIRARQERLGYKSVDLGFAYGVK